MVQKDHIAGQVPVLAAQAVGDPGTQAGMPLAQESGVHLQQSRAVGEAVGVGAAKHGHVIDAFGLMREDFRNLDPRLSPLPEGEGRSHEPTEAVFAELQERVRVHGGHGLPVPLGQFRLRVPQVHLAGAAVHEQEDAGPGLGWKVGGAVIQGRGFSGRGVERLPEEAVLGQEERQRGAGETASRLPEKLAPGPSAGGEPKSLSRLKNPAVQIAFP